MVLLARGSVTVTAVNDGVPEKLYRAWSNNANGSGYSTTDSSGKYLGTYVGLSEPTLASQYKWTLIKGETGETGQPGVSAYLHTAWANSANGQTGFSTSVSTDKLYIGTYSNSSPTPSQVYTSYKWVRIKGLDAKFYSVIVDKSFLNRNGLSSTATETIAINSYVHEGNSAGVAAPGFFIIKEQIKQTTAGVTTYVFQEKHRSTTAVSQLNYTVSANAVTVKIEFYLTNQFNNLFAVRDIGVLMDASTDIEARVPIAQLIENINNHPDTTRISGKKMHFTNDVTFDQSFHTKLFAETGFIENLSAYEFSADNIKTGTLSSVNGMSTMDLNTGAFSFAGGKLKYDGTTLSVVGSLTVASFAPALKTSFDGKLDTTKLASSGQVTIHGGNITAGTLSADKITTGTLDASKVTVENLTATNITTGTLDVGKLTLENLSASDMKTGTLNASDVNIINLSASSIKTGTLDASSVNIDNLTANSIKGGRLDLSQGLTISDGVNDILSIGTDGKVALNASSIKIGALPVATKEDVDNIALTPGPKGTSITSVTEWYLATSAATGVTTSTAGWDKTMRTMTTTNKYLWNYKVINYSEGLPQTTTPVIIGVYGTTGATGRSINSVTKHYLATSESSGIIKTDSRFTKTIQSTSPTNKYLWTYETITWNVAPLTTYVEPFIIGTHGEKGEVGTTGVGLQSITEWYLATPLKEGVTRTTSGFTESIQTLSSVNNYLWNYEQVNYDNGTKHYTDPTIIGTFGEQGISVKGVTEYYLASPLSEGITKDTPGWTTDIQPLTPENKYLWNKEIVHYSDDAAFLDKTEVLSGTEIFTDKADEEAVVHVEVDGKSYQHAGSGKNLFNAEHFVDNLRSNGVSITNISLIDIETNYFTYKTVGNMDRYISYLDGLFKENTSYTLSLKGRLEDKTNDGAQTPFGFRYTDGSNQTIVINNSTEKNFTLTSNPSKTVKTLQIGWAYNGTAYIRDIQLEEGSTATEYEPPAPTPNYPIEIHSLNDFDVVSSVGKRNLILNSKNVGLHARTGTDERLDEYLGVKNVIKITNPTSGMYINPPQTMSESTILGESYTLSVLFTYRGRKDATPRLYLGPGSYILAKGDIEEGKFNRIYITSENVNMDISRIHMHMNGFDEVYLADWKIEKGTTNTPYSPASEDILESDNHQLIDKINLLLDEPLRSVGDVKDRLFRDTDGLWKVERNVGERILNGKEVWTPQSDGSYYTSFSDKKIDINTNLQSNRFMPVIGIDGVQQLGRMRNTKTNNNVVFYFDEGVGGAANFKSWLSSNNTKVHYELANPTIENLPQVLQDKLNNLRTFKDSNYVYTVLPDKSNILSENLKPTLHATFKSKAWAGNFSGYPSIIGVYGDSAKLLYLSTSADSMTFNSDGSANPASQTITFTGNLQNVLGNVLFTAIAYNGTTVVSTISLSGVGNTRTLTQAQFPANADRVQVKATLGNLEDTVTIVKLKNGADAIVGYLTNESVTLSANNAGTVSSFSSASGTFKVFEGTIDRTSSSSTTFRVKTQTGAVATINSSSGVYAVSSMSSDTANIVFEATYKNVKIDQTLSLSKSKEGIKGIPGPQGVSITKVDVQYYLSTSNDSLVGGVWSTTAPDWKDGRFMWSKTVTTYTSGSPTESKPVCITGAKGSTGGTGSIGATGRGVSTIVEQFYLSNSKETQTGGSWSTTMPTWSPGKYVWTRSLITYTTGTPPTSTTEPLVSSEWEAINELEFGGRNYLLNSDKLITLTGFAIYLNLTDVAKQELAGNYVTISFDAKHESGSNPVAPHVYFRDKDGANLGFSYAIGEKKTTLNYQRFEITIDKSLVPTSLDNYPNIALRKNDSTNTISAKNIKLEKGNKATDWSPAPEDVQKEIKDVLDVTNTLKNFTDTAFVDGVIERAEAQAIKEHLNTLKKENNDLMNQYSTLYTNVNLVDPAKGALLTARNNYATSYASLVSVINTAISGDRTTAAQKTAVDNGFVSYTNSLQAFTQKMSEAQTAIGAKVSSDAVDAIEVGGRNLVVSHTVTDNHYVATDSNVGASGSGANVTDFIKVSPNTTYVFSNADSGTTNTYMGFYDINKNPIRARRSYSTSSTAVFKTEDEEYIRISNPNIRQLKLEKGNKATDWTPAPEDVTASIKAAQDKANAASNSASAANNLLSDIASDSVLTPGEKKSTKKEWDIIVGEKPKIDASADTYSITTQKTAYNNAYNALNTYLTGSSGLLVNLNTKSAIVGTTFRTNFKNYYNARQDLLNAISDGAKSLVDGIEIGGTNLIIRSRETVGKIIDTSGNVINSTINSLAPGISVEVGKDYTFTKTDSGSSENYFRYGWYKADGTFISRAASNTSVFTVKAPANASILKVSYPTVSKVKLEKGNKPTSWSPAPEDVQSQIDKSVKYTDVEYYLSTSNTGLAGGKWQTIAPIWDNGKYMWSRTKVVLNDGTTDYKPNTTGTNITGAKGATGPTGSTGPKGNPGENATARNFLLESKPNSPITNSNYSIANFLLAEKPVVGETYTITIKGQLAATKTAFYAYNSGGSISVASNIVHQGNGLYYKSFNWINSYSSGVSANDTSVVIYAFTSTQTGTSTIEWVTMVKGSVPLKEWVPAHEDIYQYIDDVEIGGTNLIKNSQDLSSQMPGYSGATSTVVPIDMTEEWGFSEAYDVYLQGGDYAMKSVWTSSSRVTEPMVPGQQYTHSFWIKNLGSANAIQIATNGLEPGKTVTLAPGESIRYQHTGVRRKDYDWYQIHFRSMAAGSNIRFAIGRFKLEKGNKATDWTPAPQDVQSSIDGKADGSTTESALNDASAKLQVLQQEVEAAATANELDDFIDKYNKDMQARDKATIESEGSLSSALTSITSIQNNLSDMSETWTFIDRFIKNTPQGIVVGNDSSGSYILIKEDRLSFYSNGQEVAFISQNLMEISRGAFVEQIQIAKYQFEESTTNHLTIRYVG